MITNLSGKVSEGSAKVAYEYENGYIVLCSKKKDDGRIIKEYEMLKCLEEMGLPVIEGIQIVELKYCCHGSKGLYQRMIYDAKLIKPNSSADSGMSLDVVKKMERMMEVLEEKKVVIDDFQILYNSSEMYIIDPSNVYDLREKKHVGHDNVWKKMGSMEVRYINQMRNLVKLIENSKKGIEEMRESEREKQEKEEERLSTKVNSRRREKERYNINNR